MPNYTSIHKAAADGDLSRLTHFLQMDPKLLNEKNELNSKTPLMIAAANGHTSIVKFLLEKKEIKINDTTTLNNNERGATALHYAIMAGHANVATLLMAYGADITKKMGHSHFQPIHCAAERGLTDILQLLLKKNLGLFDARDKNQQTPLLLAARLGHLEIVKELLKIENIDVNATTRSNDPNIDDKSILGWAVQGGHVEIVKQLLAHGAATWQANKKFQPIHLAALCNQFDCVKLLIENNPHSLNLPDKLKQTPLVWAVIGGHVKIVKYFLDQPGIHLFNIGIDGDYKNQTALDVANKKISLKRAEKKQYAQITALLQEKIQAKKLNYNMLYAQQQEARFKKTILAWTFGIIGGLISFGLLGILAYFLWRREKRKEWIQEIIVTPEEDRNIKTKRKRLKAASELEKPLPLPETPYSPKPEKLPLVRSKEKIVYRMDCYQAKRFRLFRDKRGTELTEKEQNKLHKWKEKSLNLFKDDKIAKRKSTRKERRQFTEGFIQALPSKLT